MRTMKRMMEIFRFKILGKEKNNKLEQIIGVMKVLTIFNKAMECESPKTRISYDVDVSTSNTVIEMEGFAGMMLYGIGKMIVEVAGRCDTPLDATLDEIAEITRTIAEVEQDEEAKSDLTIKFNE